MFITWKCDARWNDDDVDDNSDGYISVIVQRSIIYQYQTNI